MFEGDAEAVLQSLQLFCDTDRFHYLRDYQWHYHRELAIEAGLPMPESYVEYLYKHVQGKRSKFLALYKKGIYSRKNPEEFDIVYEPPEITGSK